MTFARAGSRCELQDADARQARDGEVADLVDDDEAAEDEMNRTIVTIDWRKPVTQVLRTGWW
jgi:hypothetical protein